MLPTPRSAEGGCRSFSSELFVTSGGAVPAVARTVEITPLKQELSCKVRVTSNLGNGAMDPY